MENLALTFLQQHVVIVALGTCLCVGGVLKHAFPKFPNRFIPLVLPILGVIMNAWINEFAFTPDILFDGLLSGCGAVGVHQALTPYINKIIDKVAHKYLGNYLGE